MTPGATVQEQSLELINGFDGQVAYLARNLTTGAELSYEPDRLMPSASTIKLVVLAELFRQVDGGLLSLDERVPFMADDRRGGSGILKDLELGLAPTLRDHATLMVALSDNTATAVLVRRLGLDRIMQSVREWGMRSTTATFRMGGPIGEYASSTPRDIVHLLGLIATSALVSPAASAGIRDILLTQQYHDQIGRYLPYNQYLREGYNHPGPVLIRSKSGFSYGVRVDAGIVELPQNVRYVLCLMTSGASDQSFLPEQTGGVLNGKLSKLIFDEWGPSDVPRPSVD